ncbi:Signal peptide peptidase-like 3 [Triplophysa tibetana]|uniref:Signal peptide peptidase-like 3 n=1 Tax=Triplophysa tibetana TaxID=1572043 RepID=A0A5A9N388_9TELE|nr:Signal peptide peptidase-like 3 [Triplophysa tibetana]
MAEPSYSWAYSLVDSSQVSTFLISILLIVYGSFRSLNMDCENQEKDKDGNPIIGPFNNSNTNNSIQTIDSTQALFLPIGASVSLLVMFFFFDSVQVVFTICTAVLATIAFAFLLLPMCQYVTRPCSPQNKISFGCCGRFTLAELLSFSLSVLLVLIWVLTGHWLLMDALAMGLCVAMIAFVRLPSLKVSCLLLSGLLIYDVFWVFFSAYIFNSNVMVKVATQPADNPLDVLSRKLHLGPGMGRDVPRLSLPGKLVFPSSSGSHFSMLGIGDIVMPGLLLCFVLRYDNYKKQANGEVPGTVNAPGRMQRVSYFHCTLIGYFIGLLTATVASRIHRAAQPALLYLVPFTLLPLLTMAYLKGDLRRMWSEPFHTKATSSRFLEPADEQPYADFTARWNHALLVPVFFIPSLLAILYLNRSTTLHRISCSVDVTGAAPSLTFGNATDLQTEICLFTALNERQTRDVDSAAARGDDDPIRDQHTVEDSDVSQTPLFFVLSFSF